MKLSYGGRGKPKLDGTIFMGGSLPLETPCKNFNLAIGGGAKLDKWFKNAERKVYI